MVLPLPHWVLFVTLVVGLALAEAQKQCPPQEVILPCRCLVKGEEFQIWCSHSDLPNVLEGIRALGQYIFEPIDELILENNYLPSLPGRTFLPLKVIRLMLRHNGLERVSGDWLVGLEKTLVELFIVEPDLRSLPEDSLIRMNQAEAITVQTNLMKRLPLFSGLPKLRYLQIESLSLLELSPRNFKDLPSVETIHISNSPRLSRLEAGSFQDLPRLSLLNISYCGITWMHLRAVTRLPSLKELSLIGNKIVDAGMVGRGIRDLPQLEILRLGHNYIDKIGEAAFVDMPSLRRLSLNDNHIAELHYGAFHRVPMLRTLDLNRNAVRRVHPESFLQHSGSGLEELWLIENEISHVGELRSLLDTLPRLTFLDMSYNNLEAIPFGALRGHPTLERLHLDFNKIHLIEREAFVAMPALRELRLKNNSLSDALDAPLWNLPALKGLDLSGNFFRRLEPRLLANLPSLRRVDLSSNQLTLVDPTSFLMTPSLEHVNLSRNALATLHPATFRHLLNLYELDLNHNDLVEFVPNLPRGIEYLHLGHNRMQAVPVQPSLDLDLPSLRMLDLSHNNVHRISPDALVTLPQLRRLYLGKNDLHRLDENCLRGLTRLEVLDLRDNQLNQIHPDALREMSELRELNLRGNRLDVLFPEIFKNTPQLKKLDISRNQLAEILPGTLDKIKDVQIMDASRNFLVQLPPNLSGMKNLRKLDLSENRLKFLHPGALSDLMSLTELKLTRNFIQELKQGAFDNLQHLKVLHMDQNELEAIEPNAISSLASLKSLKINKNKLVDIPNFAFSNLPSLQVAELQENRIKFIGDSAFHQVTQLLMLNLSRNRLDRLEDAGLRGLKSLEVLDLSHNRIARVTNANLEKMEWLVELRMDDNRICAVHGTPFDGMPRLRVLSLKNNRMTTLPERAVHKLRSNIAVLDIDGNPLACTCSLLWLQAWVQENSLLGPRCTDGTLLREARLSRQDCPSLSNNGGAEERAGGSGGGSAEFVAPGCEAELLTAPGTLGTSQVFSQQWMKLKSNISKTHYVENKNHLAPSPEESEYFYDDYVDYPYNETAAGVLALNNDKKEPNLGLAGSSGSSANPKNKFTTVEQASTTASSPHHTPGDTPTIYAASSKNKTKPDIPKEVVNSPSTSGFTFFGVPLPSLGGLNSFWGGGGARMDGKTKAEPVSSVRADVLSTPVAERKVAIMNNPPQRASSSSSSTTITNLGELIRPPNPAFSGEGPLRGGHSMRIGAHPTNGYQQHHFRPDNMGFVGNSNNPNKPSHVPHQQVASLGGFINGGPPVRPAIETGGFVPFLPGASGGFKPIPGPVLPHQKHQQQEKNVPLEASNTNTKPSNVATPNMPIVTTSPSTTASTSTVAIHQVTSHQNQNNSNDDNNNNNNNRPTSTVEETLPDKSNEDIESSMSGRPAVPSTSTTAVAVPPPTSSPIPSNQNVTVELQVLDDVTEVTAKIQEITESSAGNPMIAAQQQQAPEPETLLPNASKIKETFVTNNVNKSMLPITDGREESDISRNNMDHEAPSKPQHSSSPSKQKDVKKSDDKSSGRTVMATPLSALLIPGGQQPQDLNNNRPHVGRPTITKVPSPHITGSAPLLSNLELIPQISDPMPHNREEKDAKGTAFRSAEDSSGGESSMKEDTSWYFANYNKTNLEPFVGIVSDKMNSSSGCCYYCKVGFDGELGKIILMGSVLLHLV